MPNRILRDWTDSEAVNALSDSAERFFTRLIQKADDYGRYHGNPKMLRPMLYPLQLDRVTEADIVRFISECEQAGLVTCYVGDGKQVVSINNFGQSVRAAASKFPSPDKTPSNGCVADAQQMPSTRTAAAPVFGDGDGDGCVGEVGAPARSGALPELPTEEQAIAMTMTAGIPEPFTRYVFQDWSSRQGKDAGGVLVTFLPYVTKRWTRERVEWEAGTHKGKKSTPAGKVRDAGVPKLTEVQDYCREKWGDDDRHSNWASSFYRHWNDPKRGWKRGGKTIDWKIELTQQVAKWRGG